MDTPRIKASECIETLDRASQMLNDKRIGNYPEGSLYSTFLSKYRVPITSILKKAGRDEEITLKQKSYLEKMWNNYQRVVRLNQDFEKDVPDSAIALLEEAVKLAEPHIKGRRTLQARKIHVGRRIKQIREGGYFWNTHIWPAKFLLNDLNSIGVNTGDLEDRIDKLMQIVSIRP